MWIEVQLLNGIKLNAWKCPDDLVDVYKPCNKPSGNHILACIDADAPYRWFRKA